MSVSQGCQITHWYTGNRLPLAWFISHTTWSYITLPLAGQAEWQPKSPEEGSFPESEKETTTYNLNEVDTAYQLLAEHVSNMGTREFVLEYFGHTFKNTSETLKTEQVSKNKGLSQ